MRFPPRSPVFLLLVLLLGLATPLRADDVAEVILAQSRLGPDVPSWRLKIENTNRRSAFPRRTAALVFAWKDALWFYCPVDGTRGLSRKQGQVEADRANLLPLLQRVEPGFASFQVLPAAGGAGAATGQLRNGCFIESLAFAQSLAEAPRAFDARLVSLYTRLNGRQNGHTVVWFTRADGDYVFDVDASPTIRRLQLPAGAAMMDVARDVVDSGVGGRLERALQLRVELPEPGTAYAATGAHAGATDGAAGTMVR